MTTTEEKKSFGQLTFREKWRSIKDNVTVEPMLAFYIMPSVLSGLATQNLNLEKACRVNMDYGDVVCDALSRRETQNYTSEEKMIQQIVAGMQGWKTILQSFLPCMLILFWGSWSDRHGRRKPCMLIPIFGEFCAAVGLIFCTYFEKSRMEVAGITEALFPGLAGGWFTMLMGVFSYIADITTEEERTLRIGIANLMFSVCVPFGMAFSGILLKQIGFYGIFSISASMYLIAIFYGVFYINEPAIMSAKEKPKPNDKSLLADFFDKEHVVETFRVAFKEGENNRRMKVIMLMIVVMVVIGPLHGEMSVIYLFTRYKLNWSEIEFSFFSTYAMLVGTLGTIFSVGVFSHMLKINDALIGFMSSMSKILSSVVYCFAQNTFQFFFGPIVEILNGTSFISMRSIASKLVTSDELGKVNSLFGVAEALMPLVYAPLYTQVYRATIDYNPGIFFLLGGFLTFPSCIIFLWMYRVSKKEEKDKFVEDSEKSVSTISEDKNDKFNGDIIKPPTYSAKRNSTTRASLAFINTAFVKDEAIEIVKELPAAHLMEHCKL